MFSKLSKQMRDKKYHPALKTLEQLEQSHLPRIANYRLAFTDPEKMEESLTLFFQVFQTNERTDSFT